MATTKTCEICGKATPYFTYWSMYYEEICKSCKIKEIEKKIPIPKIKTQHLDDKLFEI
jgi:hypothetical protein